MNIRKIDWLGHLFYNSNNQNLQAIPSFSSKLVLHILIIIFGENY